MGQPILTSEDEMICPKCGTGSERKPGTEEIFLEENDVGICIQCHTVTVVHGGKLVEATEAEILSWPADMRARMARYTTDSGKEKEQRLRETMRNITEGGPQFFITHPRTDGPPGLKLCPCCGFAADVWRNPVETAVPQDGDYGVCATCGGIMVFGATPRQPTEDEILSWSPGLRMALFKGQDMQKEIIGDSLLKLSTQKPESKRPPAFFSIRVKVVPGKAKRLCPKCCCGADDWYNRGQTSPAQDGDVGICAVCGIILLYGATLRELTETEILVMPEGLKAKVWLAQKTLRALTGGADLKEVVDHLRRKIQ